jgi:hypothetical protein
MKHYWHEATYIPDLADAAAAWTVAKRMVELRGEDFTGGFVLRRYEPFTGTEVDLARRTDGAWRIVELGDGQVSDRPTSTRPEDLITILSRT